MATTPGTPLSAKPTTTRWLWAVRVAVVLSALMPLLILGGQAPVGLGCLALIYLGILVGLRKKTRKSGLAWAVGMGSVGLAFPLLAARVLTTEEISAWLGGPQGTRPWVGISVRALMHLALLATAIKAYYTLGREAGDWKKLAAGVLGPAIFVLILLSSPAMSDPIVRTRVAANQASAVGSLRTINIAEISYASTYSIGYSPSLSALGPASPGNSPTAAAGGLIDSVLAGGLKSGYKFTYMPGPPDKAGHIKTYAVVARPAAYGKSGRMSFFTDETGVIRKTDEDRPATAQDPPIGG